MKSASFKFEPEEADRLIATFAQKPSEETRQKLEKELSEQKEAFERMQSQRSEHGRSGGREI